MCYENLLQCAANSMSVYILMYYQGFIAVSAMTIQSPHSVLFQLSYGSEYMCTQHECKRPNLPRLPASIMTTIYYYASTKS